MTIISTVGPAGNTTVYRCDKCGLISSATMTQIIVTPPLSATSSPVIYHVCSPQDGPAFTQWVTTLVAPPTAIPPQGGNTQ